MITKVALEDIFKEDRQHLGKIAKNVDIIMNQLEQPQKWAACGATLWTGFVQTERKTPTFLT